MNKGFLLALAAALIAAPAALAHNDGSGDIGIPKNYCESDTTTMPPTEINGEWRIHDYGPLGTGALLFNGQDGNFAGDCDGNTLPGDYDWHVEYASGGGWLSVESGDGTSTGSVFCFGEVGHHPSGGPINVWDVVNGYGQAFWVAVDTTPPGCGDFVIDMLAFCPSSPCTVIFGPGVDGTYVIYVGDAATGSIGTAGHIHSP